MKVMKAMEQEALRSLAWPERLKSGATIAMAGTILIGSTACSAYESGPEPVQRSVSYPTDEFDTQCDIIPDQTIAATKELFTFEQAETTMDRPKWLIAQELGLTVYDFTDSKYEKFFKATYEIYDEEISVDEAISTARDFLELYGVELIPTATTEDILGQIRVNPYTKDELDSIDMGRLKRQLVDFIHSLSDLPVELVHYMGMKRVVFAHGPIYDDGASTSAGFVDPSDPDLSTVYINPYFPQDGILLHEMFHLWDMKECGPQGTADDSQYHELNPTPNLYENHDGYRSVESEWDGANGDNVVVTRDYGFFNIVEDKATMGASLLTPFQLNRIFNVYDSPILQEKALLLLARINDDRPKIAQYLAATHDERR